MEFSEAWDDTCSVVGLATRAGDLTELQQLIHNGASVDAADNRGWRPLHEAATVPESLECLEELLKHEDTDVNWRTHEGETALLLACKRRQGNNADDAVELLLRYGACPNGVDNEEETPLLIATKNKNLLVVKRLLNAKANPNIGDCSGWEPLHQAAMHGQHEILKCLLDAGARLDAQDECGMTPIFTSAQHGQESCLKEFLKVAKQRGQSNVVNIGAEDYATPLMIAAQQGYKNCVQILLDNQADPNLRTKDNITALHLAVQGDHADCLMLLSQRMNLQPLIGACHPSVLESYQNPPQELAEFVSPLHLAVEWESHACLKLLLDLGFSPDSLCQRTNLPIDFFLPNDLTRYESALCYAAYKENKKAMSIILNSGATCDTPMHSALHPLIRALSKPSPDVLNVLLEYGSNVNYCRPILDTNEIFMASVVTQHHLEHVLLHGCDPQLCLKDELTTGLFASALVKNASNQTRLIRNLQYILQFVVMNNVVQEACQTIMLKAKSYPTYSEPPWQEILQLIDKPSSLQHICRISIRHCMYSVHGPRLVKYLNCLSLPLGLVDYLSYKHMV